MRLAPIGLILCLALSGCGGGTTTDTSSSRSDPRAMNEATPARQSNAPAEASRAQPAAVKPAAGMPTPPAGAQWTIYCQTVAGAGHVQRANAVCEQLKSQTSLKDWYVIHGEGQSTIYYGFYRSFNDIGQADSKRAQNDRKRIDGLSDEMGNRPFKFAFFVGLDSPDPIAPPEWNLVNADGVYTLQIGAYTGSVDRKQAAVSPVREARAQGIEAYYFHGENTSSVCVGAFPESAIQLRAVETNSSGNPEQTFLQSTEPLPDALTNRLLDPENKPVRVVQDKPVVVDPQLRELMRKFPEHATNGEVLILDMTDSATGKPIKKPADSFVVPIPKAAPSALNDPTVQGQPTRVVTPQPEQGVGRLRSIGP